MATKIRRYDGPKARQNRQREKRETGRKAAKPVEPISNKIGGLLGFIVVDARGYVYRWSYPSGDPAVYARRKDADRNKEPGGRILPVIVPGFMPKYAPLMKSAAKPKEAGE